MINLDIDISLDDILENLGQLSRKELLILNEEIQHEIGSSKKSIIVPSTLEDEYKIKILKEIFNNFSLSELGDIKKQIM